MPALFTCERAPQTPRLTRPLLSHDAQLRYDDQVVIVTGAGGGLGRAYSLFYASRGAHVVVNDLSRENADRVVAEINKDKGAEAIANYDSATEGAKLVQQALDKWGRVDVLINNAGILRDKSFKSMTDNEWDLVQQVHVKGAYSCTKAVWPVMRKQKYGRIVNVSAPLPAPSPTSRELTVSHACTHTDRLGRRHLRKL